MFDELGRASPSESFVQYLAQLHLEEEKYLKLGIARVYMLNMCIVLNIL